MMRTVFAMAASAVVSAKKGKDFFLVGDYAWIRDMSACDMTFDAMNEIKKNATANATQVDDDTIVEGDIDAFITMGDNLYPVNDTAPTDEEFGKMLDLFRRDHIKDLPIYAIRGNHDCYYRKEALLELHKNQSTWTMPNFYYTQEFEVGKNGEKMGVLMIDSCLALCSNYTYGPVNGKQHKHDTETQELKDITCGDQWFVDEGNKMFDWIQTTLTQWDQDPKIIWKVSVQHHPLFGKWYNDFSHLTQDFLPLLMDHKFDLYLAGHEHCLEYANYPYDQTPDNLMKNGGARDFKQDDAAPTTIHDDMFLKYKVEEFKCEHNQESFFGDNQSRISMYKQGDAIHQITTGTTGFDLYPLCLKRPSIGRYRYASNTHHGFTMMHVDEERISLKIKGVDETTKEVKLMYQVQINRDTDKSNMELIAQFVQK